METNCVFCDIARGNAPARVIYRDTKIIAFFDKYPRVGAHTLVIPVDHHADIFSIPEPLLKDLMAVCKRIAEQFRKKLGATGVNILNFSGVDAQQTVFHIHLHILPRFEQDGIDAWPRIPFWEGDPDELASIVRME